MGVLWKPKDEPIISSMLETDVYKPLMMNFIDRFYPNLEAELSFMNRTKVDLTSYIDEGELREHLQAVAQLEFKDSDIAYYRSWSMFSETFLRKLATHRLAMPDFICKNGVFAVQPVGRWFDITDWEVKTVAIVSELYARGRAKAGGYTEEDLFKEGKRRLDLKIEFLKAHPYLKGSQFGLRRRAGSEWEMYVTRRLLEETKFLTGVSNIFLARELEVEAQGTRAHELDMAAYAYARGKSDLDARNSMYTTLRDWQQLYGVKALIMLPDAFGTDAFLEGLPYEYALDWKGFRQDSGDPLVIGEKMIANYGRLQVDSREKLGIFSDGLKIGPGTMLDIYKRFHERLMVSFGVGTDITNDVGHVAPLSLVMKLTRAAGRSTIKLSDNLAKATGDPEEINIAKRIFRYTSSFREEVRV